METELRIQEELRNLDFPCTKIIIAQRVALVEDADLILIIDNGQIIASGTSEELMASSDIYREICAQQKKGGDDNA